MLMCLLCTFPSLPALCLFLSLAALLTTEETQGMIPRTVAQVFRIVEELQDKWWMYRMEGQFLEIYNETITDLLSPPPASDPPRKHEIHHHLTTHLTSVSDILTLALTLLVLVLALLAQAQGCHCVAATLIECSSHSHSLFMLRIRGMQDGASGGKGVRVGTLNLVDLAGRERLATLGHELGASVVRGTGGERLKETQSINRSFSTLGDVVAALGSRLGAHVPYRNSKVCLFLRYWIEREAD
ncbi:kinesin motor domain-containing protein [Mycena albidolilacea]|uniref:Kinesin motor domain-containing protein n=1 Tax=Mycena albidolilacea TaxID=1033008 RepID=A0AAD7A311_9AGAR|nr:kinesin motor domain-containing protein [Mycena albidolilacea]